MGGNICKELGIVPNATIDRHRFYSLWAAYDVEKVGRLLPSTAKKFLREFAASFGTTYSDTLAEQIISRCNKSGNLDFECFKTLFVEAIRVDEKTKSRVHLTSSLLQTLPPLAIEWDDLPDELLSEIFSYLESGRNYSDRKSVSLVSKRWRGLSMSVFTSYAVQPCSFGYHKSLDNIMHHLNLFFPRLHYLTITESLWLRNKHLKVFPPTLQSINISHCQKITNKGLRFLEQCCPDIKSYYMGFCYGLSFPGLVHLSPKADALDISGWLIALADNPWYTYLPKELTYLNLSHSDINDTAIEKAQGSWPAKLKKLVIQDCPKVTDTQTMPSSVFVVRYDDRLSERFS